MLISQYFLVYVILCVLDASMCAAIFPVPTNNILVTYGTL